MMRAVSCMTEQSIWFWWICCSPMPVSG